MSSTAEEGRGEEELGRLARDRQQQLLSYFIVFSYSLDSLLPSFLLLSSLLSSLGAQFVSMCAENSTAD